LETEEKALEFHYLDSWTTTKTTQRFPWPQNNVRENLSKERTEFDPFSFLFLFCFFFVVFFTRTQVPTICFLSLAANFDSFKREDPATFSRPRRPPHCSKSKDEKQSLPILYYIIRRQELFAHVHSQDKTQILPSLSLSPLAIIFSSLAIAFSRTQSTTTTNPDPKLLLLLPLLFFIFLFFFILFLFLYFLFFILLFCCCCS